MMMLLSLMDDGNWNHLGLFCFVLPLFYHFHHHHVDTVRGISKIILGALMMMAHPSGNGLSETSDVPPTCTLGLTVKYG
jgi:hypothetical protein